MPDSGQLFEMSSGEKAGGYQTTLRERVASMTPAAPTTSVPYYAAQGWPVPTTRQGLFIKWRIADDKIEFIREGKGTDVSGKDF